MQLLSTRRTALLAIMVAAFALAACNKPDGKAEAKTEQSTAHADRGEKQASADQKGKEAKQDEHGAESRLKLSAEETSAAGIKIEELKTQSLVDQVVLTATIRANQDRIAHVAPRVSARIVKVNAKLGDSVKAGQTLALLDSIELGEAHSAYQQAQSQFALAKADFERAQKLKAERHHSGEGLSACPQRVRKGQSQPARRRRQAAAAGCGASRIGERDLPSVFPLKRRLPAR